MARQLDSRQVEHSNHDLHLLNELPLAYETEVESASIDNLEHEASTQSVVATEGTLGEVDLGTCDVSQLNSVQPGCDEGRGTFISPISVVRNSQTKQPQVGGVKNKTVGALCPGLLEFETSWNPEVLDPRSSQGTTALCHLGDVSLITRDILYTFLHDSEDLYELEEVLDLCGDATLEDVVKGKGRAGDHRHVWIDEKTNTEDSGSRGTGDQNNPLTSTGLVQVLQHLPTAARRLIYISGLDPHSILALATSTPRPQALALRTAFHKHITFQASIGVTVPTSGCPTFQLELHLPFFQLRKTSGNRSESMSKAHKKEGIQRRFTDLSFPAAENLARGELGLYGISKVHFSCLIIGSDEKWWTAYQFVDYDIDEYIKGQSQNIMNFDQIPGTRFDGNMGIYRPCDYMLYVLGFRMAQVRREWAYIVRKLDTGINQYKHQHDCDLVSSPASGDRSVELRQSYHWTMQTKILLRRLTCVLSNQLDEWAKFSSSSGGIQYFHEQHAMTSLESRKSLIIAAKHFTALETYHKCLQELEKGCSDTSEALKLRLYLNSKENTDSIGSAVAVAVSILFPFSLTAALFSMEPSVLPWTYKFETFAITLSTPGITTFLIRWGVEHRAVRAFFSWIFQSLFKKKVKVKAHKLDDIFDLRFDVEGNNNRV